MAASRPRPLGLGWPNLLSAFRVLLVPVLVALVLVRTRAADVTASGVFALGALTDGLDGYLARRWDGSTRTGQWLDPLADKLLVGAPIVTLTALDRFPLWAAVLIVGREVVVTALRSFLGTRGRSMPASRAAKVKTMLQLVAITMYLLPLTSAFDAAKGGVLIAAVAMTLATGFAYVMRARGELRRAGRPA